MHVSNEWNELVGDEVFPVQISTQTYQYVKQILTARPEREDGKRLSVKSGTANFYIDPAEVSYVETAGAKSLIHFADKDVTVNDKIGVLEKRFPSSFLRVHRSYLVNSAYILTLERYVITLSNNQRIPVPEKRYHEIKEAIAAGFGELPCKKEETQ